MLQEFLEFLNKNFDVYTRRARLNPALLTVLPLSLTAIACFPNDYALLCMAVSLAIASGGTALLAQLGRNFGKQKETELFAAWGGKPTTRMLRYRDTSNKIALERRHCKLQQLIPDLHIPTLQEEQDDPQHADEVYETCVAFLLRKTRSTEKFPLVFEENCNYGFHRNLWGLKPAGIILSSFGAVTIAVFAGVTYLVFKSSVSLITIACGAIDALFLMVWIFVVTPDWIKPIAESYAERLLEACEELLPD